MPEDASLDRFVAADADERDEDAASETADAGADASETGDAEVSKVVDDDPAAEVTPAEATYDWSPQGGECADCGQSVERRWRADGQRDGELVCADCKQW